MIAFKCDRCGSFYDDYEGIHDYRAGGTTNGVNFVRLGHFGQSISERKKYELCPNCMRKLLDFIVEGGDTDVEQISGGDN